MSESYYRCKECGSYFDASARHWQAWEVNVPVQCQDDEEPELQDIQYNFCSLSCSTTWQAVQAVSGEITVEDFQ